MRTIIKPIAVFFILALTAHVSDAQSWNLTGNAGTNASSNFIGTTDAINFKIRTSNVIRVNITSSGKIGIGNFSPIFKLDVKGGSINTDSLYRIGGKTVISINGTNNFFGGVNSGSLNTSGSENAASGSNSLKSNTTGSNNAAFGESSLRTNNTGNQNTACGSDALRNNTTGSYNSALGTQALNTNTSGDYNTASGVMALTLNTSGFGNTATGTYCLFTNLTGNYNTASGLSALSTNSTGNNNTALGYLSLYLNNTGSNNTACGYDAARLNESGFSNVAVGVSALRGNHAGSNIVAIGDSALYNHNASSGGTYANTAVGSKALFTNTSGYYNTASGAVSLYFNTTGNGNSAYGTYSLYHNTTGGNNTSFGITSMNDNTTGSDNTAFGSSALRSNISASSNSAFGSSALINNDFGIQNVACGSWALGNNNGGSKNTALGFSADVMNGGLINATAIGANAKVGKNNSMVLGDTSSILVGIGTSFPATRLHIKFDSNSTNPHILLEESANDFARLSFKNNSGANYWSIAGLNSATIANERLNFYNSSTGDIMSITGDGKVGIGITTPSQKLTVFNGTSTGTYTTTGWMHTSDERLKTNIKPLENSLDKILKLEGVSYNWKANPNANNQVGFIAQEVEKVFPEVIVKDAEGNYSMAPQNLTAPIVEAIKEQQKQIELKDEAIKDLQNENKLLKSRLDNFESALSQCCMSYEQKTGNINNPSMDLAKLEQNQPNPFTEKTTIKFYLPLNSGSGVIKIYTIDGSLIKSIPVSAKGFGQIEISASALNAGTYNYMLFIDGKVTDSKQMILTR